MIEVRESDDLRALATELCAVLRDAPADPFEPEWIAIPSAAMQRWLQLEIARRVGATPGKEDGVAANISFRFPGALRSAVIDADRGRAGADDPWHVDRLVWSVLAALDRVGAEPGGPAMPVPRYARARHIADLFDRYALHRPEMVLAWARGHDLDAAGRPLPAEFTWQAHLWRAIRADIGEASAAERMPELLEDVRAGRLALGLPGRLFVFGLSTFPGGPGFARLVAAVGEHHDVHCYLPSPAADFARAPHHDPLLDSWAKPVRERLELQHAAELEGTLPRSLWVPSEPFDGGSLLATLKAHVGGASELTAPAPDDSVQVHLCHGALREAEVARDAILHAISADPTLRTEDVAVLCPHLEDFLPSIEAAFGPAVSGDDPHRPATLPYRVADRSLRDENPVAGALLDVVRLSAGRQRASEVLEIIARDPVRRRFGLTDRDVARIRRWIADANIRWGLTAAGRARWGVPETYEGHTWRTGIDRLLVGVAASEEGGTVIGGIAPIDVEGDGVALCGVVADIVARLDGLAAVVAARRTVAEWCALFAEVADDFVATTDRWQLDAVQAALMAMEEAAAGATALLDHDEACALLEERLAARGRSAQFFRGGVTVSSLTPLRWVPFRVICVLGLDDAVAGEHVYDGDDLMTFDPRPGDPDVRADAREALLEALLCARDRFVVTTEAFSVRTGAPLPRPVVLDELYEAIDRVVGDGSAHGGWVRAHPRHAFGARNFVPGALDAGAWGFDPAAWRAAAAAAGPRRADEPFLAAPLDGAPVTTVTVGDLAIFIVDPVRAFLRSRLGLARPAVPSRDADDLPVERDGLVAARVGRELLAALGSGADAASWRRAEESRGTVPVGALGEPVLDEIEAEAAAIFGVVSARARGSRGTVPVDVALGGTRIVGDVVVARIAGLDGVERDGVVDVRFERPGISHELRAWVRLLALTLVAPGPWRALIVRREPSANEPAALAPVVELMIAGADDAERSSAARDGLSVLLDCFGRGMREPLPFVPAVSRLLALGQRAAGAWERGPRGATYGPGTDPELRRALGVASFAEFCAIGPRDGDPPGGSSRAERYARYVFDAYERTVRVVA